MKTVLALAFTLAPTIALACPVCARDQNPTSALERRNEVLDEMEAQSEFDLLGLFVGVGLPQQSHSDIARMPNMVWLYRRPILDYWAEHEETLGHIVRHVLIHEIGHHFGLSDADMEAIEAGAG